MNRLQPLQYQSMFVPTNMDMMNKQIMAREDEYKQNEAMIAAAQDQYSQLAVDPSASKYKNEVLGELNQNVNQMIQDKQGDIGAIDKRSLVHTMNSIRPKVQNMQRYSALAEEQRQSLNKAGADLQQGIGSFDEWNATDESRGSAPKVGFTSDYQKYVDSNYGDLAKRMEQTGLFESGVDGLLTRKTQFGTNSMQQDDFDKLRNTMVSDLRENQGASKGVAESIVDAKIRGYDRGYKYQDVKEPGYVNLDKQKSVDPNAEAVTFNTSTGSSEGWSNEDLTAKLGSVNETIANLEKTKEALKFADIGNNISDQPGGSTRTYAETVEYNRVKDQATIAQKEYDNAIKPFKGGMFDELTKSKEDGGHGYSESEAADIIGRRMNMMPDVFNKSFYTDDKEINNKMLTSIIQNADNIDYTYDYEGDKAVKRRSPQKGMNFRSSKNLSQVTDAANKGYGVSDGVLSIELDPSAGENKEGVIKITTKTGDVVGLPYSSFKMEGVPKILSDYSKMKDMIYGIGASGKSPKIDFNGYKIQAVKEFDENRTREIDKGGNVVSTGQYGSQLNILDRNDNIIDTVNPDEFEKLFATGFMDYLNNKSATYKNAQRETN